MKENGHDVVSISLHPGNIIETNLGMSNRIECVKYINWKALTFWRFWQIKKFQKSIEMALEIKSLQQGAATTIVCALAPNVQPDRYYEDCNVSDRVHHAAFDKDIAAKLWTVSVSMVGL
jgi:hypothetical protein